MFSCSVMIETVVDAPAYKPLGVPVTEIWTGKDATLELLDDAIRLTEETTPYIDPLEVDAAPPSAAARPAAAPDVVPLRVMTAWSPTLTCPTSVSSTDVLTT